MRNTLVYYSVKTPNLSTNKDMLKKQVVKLFNVLNVEFKLYKEKVFWSHC